MMNFVHLRYLVAAAQHRSFRRAAIALRIAQPTLSKRIRELEDSLGVVLFERSTSGAHLTADGENVAARAKQVLIDLDSMQQHRFDAFALTAHVRDLRRFMQNWQDDNALYNAFVETFRVIYEDFEPLEKSGIFQNKEIA